ncbi:IQ and ubiquitin-like domain-containing protein isoform X1 [Lagopus muta]|uniref:IQ and ubiquitin-like domain-containing protein isoform X1 n=1 Tax=Lagopus muta TaxID=64668 RepID=UPI00209CCB14|nr:IQ and ubiquitin-like domain-containing protein isoform X1 [Lagopus muta]XP_048793973.1 IQ and ubiquitin-like domain-containing protein isoform X1 [Lagopus muta]
MEGASESCPSGVPAGAQAAEQPPAGPRQAGSTEPSGEALLHPAASTMQAEEGCKLLASWEQAGAALREAPGEGLCHQEVMGDGNQGVLEPQNPFSASPENASPVAVTKSSTLPELRSSEREEETSQNASLSENVTSSTGTGSIIQTVVWSRAEFHETTQSEKLCLDLELLPSKAAQQDYHMPDVITVRVQMADSESFHDVAVKIERPTFRKPFLGGFKNRLTGVEFHNAGSQTVPKKRPEKGTTLFCRETQTVFERNRYQQTTNPTSTQMTKSGLYVSNTSDKLITPGKYLTAQEYHKRRLEAVIVLQKYFRRWHARNIVQNLKEKKRLRLAWEAQEVLQREKEKEDKLRMEQERKLNPKTKEDFDLLYHALESWRQEEMERINRTLTGAERKAALCGLLEQETQLIASIGRHKLNADEDNQQKAVLHFLDKCAQPKRWKACDGKITEMDTQYTLRARELLEIYRSVSMNDIPKDERRDVLLTLRGTVKEHKCKLTQEIVELIDREVDLMSREVKECNLEGLRKRICTLFLQYIKIPKFNPEVARILKVPPDPLKLYKNVHLCCSCQNYLPATEFPIPANSHTVGRCHFCCKLDNEARQRESFLKYRLILESLRKSEADYKDDARIVFLVQQQHLQYMIENIWGCQSALSSCNDLYDLVMVRWDKQQEWSPWNTILLTKDEADAHLKLHNLQEAYEASFIHGIKHKHIRAKKYFAQIPVMTSLFHRSDKQANAS